MVSSLRDLLLWPGRPDIPLPCPSASVTFRLCILQLQSVRALLPDVVQSDYSIVSCESICKLSLLFTNCLRQVKCEDIEFICAATASASSAIDPKLPGPETIVPSVAVLVGSCDLGMAAPTSHGPISTVSDPCSSVKFLLVENPCTRCVINNHASWAQTCRPRGVNTAARGYQTRTWRCQQCFRSHLRDIRSSAIELD